MVKKKRHLLMKKLRFDEDWKTYRCEHSLDGKPIGIWIKVVEGCESDALEKLVDSSEALFREWPTLRETILEAARKELVSFGCLEPGDESKVTVASASSSCITSELPRQRLDNTRTSIHESVRDCHGAVPACDVPCRLT